MKTKKKKIRSASLLVITLWVLLILSSLLLSVSYAARSQIRYARHLNQRSKLYYLARAGIEKATAVLVNQERPQHTAFSQAALNSPELFKDISLGEGFVTLSYEFQERPGSDKIIFYGIEDESSRIDINKAPPKILKKMLERIAGLEKEEALELAKAIVAWRSQPTAELEQYYRQLEPPYENKGSDFEILEELLLVRGMSLGVFGKIREMITVYGTEKVNINTAGVSVFYALGLNKDLSRRIIEYRSGPDGKVGTDKDNLFKKPTDLRKVGFLFTEDSIQINNLIADNLIKVGSDTFRINSSSRLNSGQSSKLKNIVCVLRLVPEQAPKILYWYEN